jgi:hypothetical protein
MAAKLSIGRKIAVVFLIVVFGLFLGVAFNMDSIMAAYQQGRDTAFYTSLHDSCISSATQSAQANGMDAATVKPRVEAYCGCIVQQAHNRLPPDAAASLDLASAAGQSKMTELAQACIAQITQ